ncbi:MAG: DUF1778 domain-containing protein, partial [Gemmatimonadota bacterium]|nr:DUF1778 domain-containing protein [Gemmatimonadota bacterium]
AVMTAKSSQLQIRVTPRQKSALKQRAALAGLDVSAFVLSRALPPESARFADLLRALRNEERARFVLAELNDFLETCAPATFADAVAHADVAPLPARTANYVAAMVEMAAHRKGVAPPEWTAGVPPLDEPWFGTSLTRLRPHLLAASPAPFRRRNIFVDATIGDRV